MPSRKSGLGLVLRLGAFALSLTALTLAAESGSAEPDGLAMHHCPHAGKWAMSVWAGEDGTDAGEAFLHCNGPPDFWGVESVGVWAAYGLDRVTGAWSRWLGPAHPANTLTELDHMEAVMAFGGPLPEIADPPTPTVVPPMTNTMHNCPLEFRWSIAVWSGPPTPTRSAFLSCGDLEAVEAAYYLDPMTQAWYRWFNDPALDWINTLDVLDHMDAVQALGGRTKLDIVAEGPWIAEPEVPSGCVVEENWMWLTFNTAGGPVSGRAEWLLSCEHECGEVTTSQVTDYEGTYYYDEYRLSGTWVEQVEASYFTVEEDVCQAHSDSQTHTGNWIAVFRDGAVEGYNSLQGTGEVDFKLVVLEE